MAGHLPNTDEALGLISSALKRQVNQSRYSIALSTWEISNSIDINQQRPGYSGHLYYRKQKGKGNYVDFNSTLVLSSRGPGLVCEMHAKIIFVFVFYTKRSANPF